MEYVRYCNNCYRESPPNTGFCLHCGSHMTVLTPKQALAPQRGWPGIHLSRRGVVLALGSAALVILFVITLVF